MPATERADSVVLAGRCTVSIEWRLFSRGAGFLSLYLPPPAMEGKTPDIQKFKKRHIQNVIEQENYSVFSFCFFKNYHGSILDAR